MRAWEVEAMAEPSGQDTAERQDSHRSVEQWPEGTTDVEDLLQRRVPLRIRALQGLGLLVGLVVVVSVIGRSLQTPLNHAPAVVPTSTPVSLGPVLVLSNVSFGTIIVNGTPLTGRPPLVTSFRRGLNTMILTAPPFRPQTCQVMWPDAQVQGTCDLRRDVSAPYHVGGRSVTPVALVELWLSSDDLPAAVRERTLANISA